MIKGIIFDYGGTIDSRGEHWSEVIYRGWLAAGILADKDSFRHCYVVAERTLAKEYIIRPDYDFHRLILEKARIEIQEFINQGGMLPSSSSMQMCAQAIADYCDRSARECVEEARPVLETLSKRFPLMLVSNFYGNVDAVLRTYRLRQYFQGVIESAVVGVRKPDPRIFMLGVVALGLEPQEVLVVGDSLRKDIIPAESIGCHVAWIKGKGWDDAEDAASHPAQIQNLAQLTNLQD